MIKKIADELVLKKITHKDLNSFFELCSDEILFKYKPGKAKKNIQSVDNWDISKIKSDNVDWFR
jgi:hypothetical protein